MAKNTKEKILDTALEMFAENGYSGTNIRELSEKLGLSKAAMYRHFKSKEDLWDCLYNQMLAYYDERFGSEKNISSIPSSCEELIQKTMQMVDFTIHDRKIVLMRKIIMTEQFRYDRIRDMANEFFLNRTSAIFKNIFEEMIKKGCIKQIDPSILAFAYTTPITALIHLYDRDPKKEKEIFNKIKAFSEHFTETYGIQNTGR